MAKLYLVKTQVLLLRVGGRGAGFLPHPLRGALMFRSSSGLGSSELKDLYLLPQEGRSYWSSVWTELVDPLTGEGLRGALMLFPALFAFEREYVLEMRAPLAPKRISSRFEISLQDYRADALRLQAEKRVVAPCTVEAEVVETEAAAERTAGTGFIEKVVVNGVTLSRWVVPLATMLGRSGYEPFRWIDPRIDSELARLEPLEVKPVHGFELREERRKRGRERSLKGRGSGWQATLETFIRVEPSGAPG
jgi:hypothetical protein